MKQHAKHKYLDEPRPPEGTILPITGMVVGPDPRTRGGPADLGNPLKARKPWLFSRAWRNKNQRARDEIKAKAAPNYNLPTVAP